MAKRATPAVRRAASTIKKNISIAVRQIENGFLVTESGTRGSGNNKEWYSKDTFSKSNPVKLPSKGKK